MRAEILRIRPEDGSEGSLSTQSASKNANGKASLSDHLNQVK
jgi:hypothetical protein